jgi:single-stranded DNA-binding protein
MTEASVSFAGNLTDDPEVRSTEAGIARARFRVAVSGVGPMRKNPVVLRQAYPDGRS